MLSWSAAGAELEQSDAPQLVEVGIMAFPDYSYLDKQGAPAGAMVDLTRLLLDRAGYQANLRILPSARIWRGLEDGDVHLWPGIVNKPGLDDFTLLTERDLAQVWINLYYLPGRPRPVWPGDLQGKRLIVITNYTYIKSLLDRLQDPALGISFASSISHAGAVEMLLRGRADFLLNYRAQVDPIVASMGLEPLPYIKIAEHPMRFVLSRQSGFADQLKVDLDRAFDELAAEGVELDVAKRLQLQQKEKESR
ncbi:substrate-binding periplasmic protein [Halopseudomonas pelagia]|uniref:substrate-binding periplasmic protein n=1 Tax=Halopseudomonas pelagia TaxID=553151 RepID=UPI001378AF98|nr:transporter substrate-binding domain-containing protein [Halopseudomonas pelagia]